MFLIVSLLRRYLPIAVIAALLTTPTAAWDSHALLHLDAPVAVDQHHYHGADGSIELADHDHDGDKEDRDGFGHDHLPSLSVTTAALTVASPNVSLPLGRAPPQNLRLCDALADRDTEPQKEPPRFA